MLSPSQCRKYTILLAPSLALHLEVIYMESSEDELERQPSFLELELEEEEEEASQSRLGWSDRMM